MADKSFVIRVPDQLHRRLKTHAKSDGRSMAEIVRRAIAEYLNKREGT